MAKREIYTGLKPQSKKWSYFWGAFVRSCETYTAPENYYAIKNEIRSIRSRRTSILNRMKKLAATNPYFDDDQKNYWIFDTEGSYLGQMLVIVRRLRRALQQRNEFRRSGQFDKAMAEYLAIKEKCHAIMDKSQALSKEEAVEYNRLIDRSLAIKETYHITPEDVRNYESSSLNGHKGNDKKKKVKKDAGKPPKDAETKKPEWAHVLNMIELDSRVAKLRPRPQTGDAKIAEYLQYCNFLQYYISKSQPFTAKRFLYELCRSVDLNDIYTEKSNYKILRFPSGVSLEFRLSNHQSNCGTFVIRHKNFPVNFGIVIKNSKNEFKPDDKVNYIEFVYYSDKMEDAQRQIDIIEGFKRLIEMGSIASMPEADRLNTSGIFREIIPVWK